MNFVHEKKKPARQQHGVNQVADAPLPTDICPRRDGSEERHAGGNEAAKDGESAYSSRGSPPLGDRKVRLVTVEMGIFEVQVSSEATTANAVLQNSAELSLELVSSLNG